MSKKDASGPGSAPGKASALLTDIVASTTRHDSRDRTEEDVMRISSDPLLLHRYLQSSANLPKPSPHPTTIPFVAGATWPIHSKAGIEAIDGGRSISYSFREPFAERSLEPEPFTATESDIASAIDHDTNPAIAVSSVRSGSPRMSPLTRVSLFVVFAAALAFTAGILS